MFGDDPDPMVMKVWFGSRTTFGRAREEGRGLTREVRLDLAVGSGLWRDCEGEKRERGPSICFWRPKTSDVRPAILPL